MLLHANEIALHDAHLDELEVELTRAHAESTLPEEPTTARELDDFVVRIRLERELSR
jgi:hypothetical protein